MLVDIHRRIETTRYCDGLIAGNKSPGIDRIRLHRILSSDYSTAVRDVKEIHDVPLGSFLQNDITMVRDDDVRRVGDYLREQFVAGQR
jgi:hypothetical protein